ncbi:MAG: DUF503 domain-containing protein [bacterium]|nr:DUF503 domain-containing protein [bacterium]
MILDYHAKGSHSLKEKRQILNSIKGKLKQRFNISIIESDYQDTWQKLQLTVAMVSNAKSMIEKAFEQMEDFIFENYALQLISVEKEYM